MAVSEEVAGNWVWLEKGRGAVVVGRHEMSGAELGWKSGHSLDRSVVLNSGHIVGNAG